MRVRYSFSSRRTRKIGKINKQRQKYPNLADKIVEVSDIILEILDARFCEETRNKELEEMAKAKGKKLIFVINKIDLVSKDKQKEIRKTLKPNIMISCKDRKGISNLRSMIKRTANNLTKIENKALKKDKVIDEEHEKVQVGVIGYPNTGKSSLLNLLVGKASAGVGSDAGFTKGVQKIKLSQDIVLIDTPGVIPREDYSSSEKTKIAQHTILGGRSYSQVKDPDLVVQNIMLNFPGVIQRHYKIKLDDSEELIEELGKKKGFLKKGGTINEDQTARFILKEWQLGKIKI